MQRRVIVAAEEGLHARPAALFVSAVATAGTAVTIGRADGAPVDARSMLAVLSLDVRHGDEVVLTADGDGAGAVLDHLAALLASADPAPAPPAPALPVAAPLSTAPPVAAVVEAATAAGEGGVFGGIGVGTAAAVGPVVWMPPPLGEPAATPSSRPPGEEAQHARSALRSVAAELRERAGRAGGPGGDVLRAQALIALDPSLVDAVEGGVAGGLTAARAVFDAFTTFREALAAAGPYLAQRVGDLDDVRQRAVAACLGVPVPRVPEPDHPFVLVALDLAPADTAGLDRERVLGLVTVHGGPTSHTAILARAMGVPAVVACAGAERLREGTTVLVDAANGRVVADPPGSVVAGLVHSGHPSTRESTSAVGAGGVSVTAGRTADGRPVALLANVGRPEDAADAVRAGAEGVGLFRTEFLFLDARVAPDEASQLTAYRSMFSAFPGQRVVVRVLDAGADKPLAFLNPAAEPNPALGQRGLRALRRSPSILDTQLAAIAAAAAGTGAHPWVMAPMVAEPEEAAWFVARAAAHGLATAGVMIEVPSAALLAEEILAACSFVSLGTNDLAQYTLAVDRQLGGLAALQDPWHPALLRLVELVGAAGARAGKPVGVCGEAAADPRLACVLVGLGVTSLSMAPPALAAVRTALATRSHDDCRRLARLAVATSSAAEARAAVAAAATVDGAEPTDLSGLTLVD